MTPREKQMLFRHRAKMFLNFVAFEAILIVAVVTWLLEIW